jgi:hypothetical protein
MDGSGPRAVLRGRFALSSEGRISKTIGHECLPGRADRMPCWHRRCVVRSWRGGGDGARVRLFLEDGPKGRGGNIAGGDRADGGRDDGEESNEWIRGLANGDRGWGRRGCGGMVWSGSAEAVPGCCAGADLRDGDHYLWGADVVAVI